MTTVVIRICDDVRMILSPTPADTLTSQHPNSSQFADLLTADFTRARPHRLIRRPIPAHAPAAHSMEEIEEKVKMSKNPPIAVSEQCLFARSPLWFESWAFGNMWRNEERLLAGWRTPTGRCEV